MQVAACFQVRQKCHTQAKVTAELLSDDCSRGEAKCQPFVTLMLPDRPAGPLSQRYLGFFLKYDQAVQKGAQRNEQENRQEGH